MQGGGYVVLNNSNASVGSISSFANTTFLSLNNGGEYYFDECPKNKGWVAEGAPNNSLNLSQLQDITGIPNEAFGIAVGSATGIFAGPALGAEAAGVALDAAGVDITSTDYAGTFEYLSGYTVPAASWAVDNTAGTLTGAVVGVPPAESQPKESLFAAAGTFLEHVLESVLPE
jgi:hypothetical protein